MFRVHLKLLNSHIVPAPNPIHVRWNLVLSNRDWRVIYLGIGVRGWAGLEFVNELNGTGNTENKILRERRFLPDTSYIREIPVHAFSKSKYQLTQLIWNLSIPTKTSLDQPKIFVWNPHTVRVGPCVLV